MAGGRPLRIAHGHGNSRELVRVALENRVDVIEADVRLRRGRLTLAHGRPPLEWVLLGKRLGWGLLLVLDLLTGRRSRSRRDSFLLEELPPTVAGRCGLLLDLKSPLLARNRRRFVGLLIPILRRSDQTSIRLCGDWLLLDAVRQALPESSIYYSVADGRRRRALVRRLEESDDICGVSLRARLFDESSAGLLRGKGVEVFCWPVDDLAEAERVIALGAGGIISGDLSLLAAIARSEDQGPEV
jgi:glycerophosphoryl diester phosphodiesterase